MIGSKAVSKIDKHIEVVTTDTAGMKETAFGSVETSRKVCDVLENHYARVVFNEVQSEQELADIARRRPDLVVPCVKYITGKNPNEKIWLSDFFSRHSIPYSGSNRATLEYDSDKSKAKRAVLDLGLATAKFFFAIPGLIRNERQLPLQLPLFVKPMDAANGHGIDERSLVHDFASYNAKILEVFAIYGVPVLVEEYLPGREFTVAVLDDPSRNQRLISPVEIIVPANAKGDRILGHLEKTGNHEKLLTVSEPELTAVSDLASKVFSALDVRDFGRIDIKMDAYGIPHFIEANLMPGMTPKTSYFPRACLYNQGMSYENVVLRIIELALIRAQMPANTPPTDLPTNSEQAGRIAA